MYYVPYCISWFFLFNGLFFAKADNVQLLFISSIFMIAAAIMYRKR